MSKEEKKRAYNKEWKAKNKKRISEYGKKYRIENEKKIKLYMKDYNKKMYDSFDKEIKKKIDREYYLKNKYKIEKRRKQWVKDNLSSQQEYKKQWSLNKKDGYHRVYLLEDYNYVGVTQNICNRFAVHKTQLNRDCSNHRILYKTKDRSEALELEALLHDMGYEGKKRHNE